MATIGIALRIFLDGPSGVLIEWGHNARMPNIATVLKAEITRLARKELREESESLPLAKVGLIGWDIIPLGAFSNWELLFAPTN